MTVGAKKPGGLGIDALLDFSVGLTLDGEELTEEERLRILSETSGLVLLRGKWVEIDREKLSALLSFWEKRKKEDGGEGISFSEGMRLLAGAGMEGKNALPAAEASREWLHADAGEWLRSILDGMRSPDGIAPADPGRDLKTTLRPYQQTGVAWLRFMHELGLGACLADDMGLGKTIQVLALLLLLRQQKASGTPPATGPALLVVPASLVANWKAEIGRFAPSLAAFYAHPSETPAAALAMMADPQRRAATLSGMDLVITTYAMIHRAAWLREVSWGSSSWTRRRRSRTRGRGRRGPSRRFRGKRGSSSPEPRWRTAWAICGPFSTSSAPASWGRRRSSADTRRRQGTGRTTPTRPCAPLCDPTSSGV